tara:strand:+ start:1312 stop:2127 length:816 start_codon:yes stop_codon:yes gene_type:complete
MNKISSRYKFLLSIIVVSYNSEKYIKQALDSVLSQINNQWELIIIDGNSTDSTKEIIQSYKKFISFFISENDKGIYYAMNKGISKAKGTHISFLNSDDIYLPEFVNSISHAFSEVDKPFFCAPVYLLDNNDNKVGKYYPVNNHSRNYLFKSSPFPHLGLVVKSTLFRDIGGFNLEYKFCADYELMIRLINKFGYGYQCIPFISACYRENGQSSRFSASLESSRLIYKEGNLYYYLKYFYRYILIRILKKVLGKNLFLKMRKKMGRNLNYKI